MSTVYGLFTDWVSALAALLPAVAGGIATLYVDVLNIALEGLILAGAFSYIYVGSMFGPAAGFAAALAVPALTSYLADLFSRKTRADPFVVGLSVNVCMPALISIISYAVFSTKGVVNVDALAAPRFFHLRLSDMAAYCIAALLTVYIAASPFGRRAKASGENAASAAAAGINGQAIRARCYIFSGLGCGAAGAALAASIGAWVPNMSSGRGWIALVVMYLGGKNLSGAFLASAAFAFLLAAASKAQAFIALPADILMAIPYFLTAAIVISGISKSKSEIGADGL